MKKLVIEILEKNGAQYWRVTEQTHRGGAFVENGSDEFNHADFRLQSCAYPAAITKGAYLRGSSVGDDDNLVPVPNAEWLNGFEAAVKAYNKWGAKQKEPKAIKYARPKGYKLVRVIE